MAFSKNRSDKTPSKRRLPRLSTMPQQDNATTLPRRLGNDPMAFVWSCAKQTPQKAAPAATQLKQPYMNMRKRSLDVCSENPTTLQIYRPTNMWHRPCMQKHASSTYSRRQTVIDPPSNGNTRSGAPQVYADTMVAGPSAFSPAARLIMIVSVAPPWTEFMSAFTLDKKFAIPKRS